MGKYIQLYEEYTEKLSNGLNMQHSWQEIRDVLQKKLPFIIIDFDSLEDMNKCIEDKANGICNLLAKKHFDPEHPENHNIRKLNKKDNFLEIYNNNKWNTRDYKSGLDHITIPLETTFSIFMEKMVEQNCEIRKNIFQHL